MLSKSFLLSLLALVALVVPLAHGAQYIYPNAYTSAQLSGMGDWPASFAGWNPAVQFPACFFFPGSGIVIQKQGQVTNFRYYQRAAAGPDVRLFTARASGTTNTYVVTWSKLLGDAELGTAGGLNNQQTYNFDIANGNPGPYVNTGDVFGFCQATSGQPRFLWYSSGGKDVPNQYLYNTALASNALAKGTSIAGTGMTGTKAGGLFGLQIIITTDIPCPQDLQESNTNGTWSYTNAFVGGTGAVLTCSNGYATLASILANANNQNNALSSTGTYTCAATVTNGETSVAYTGTKPECKPLSCTAITETHGSWSPAGKVPLGVTASLSCDSLYEATGAGQATCTAGTGPQVVYNPLTVPVCQAVGVCTVPSDTTNPNGGTATDYSGTPNAQVTAGSTLTGQCGNGYAFSDTTVSKTFTCTTSNGNTNWSPTLSACIATQCSLTDLTASHGSWSGTGNNLLPGGTATFSCSNGYSGGTTATCVGASDGTSAWNKAGASCSAIACTPPLTDSQGTWTGASTGDSATLTCNQGYTGDGSTLACQAQTGPNVAWASGKPTCQAVSCGTAPTVSHGSWSGAPASTGGKITLTCADGYTGSGAEMTCSATGETTSAYSGQTPSCTAAKCTDLTDAHGTWTSNVGVDSSATLTCSTGYNIDVDTDWDCVAVTGQAAGEWQQGTKPTCVADQCTALPSTPNGEWSSPTLFSETSDLSCEDGYESSGATSVECVSDGGDGVEFDPNTTPGTCEAIACDVAELADPYGTWSAASTGQTATLTCDPAQAYGSGSVDCIAGVGPQSMWNPAQLPQATCTPYPDSCNFTAFIDDAESKGFTQHNCTDSMFVGEKCNLGNSNAYWEVTPGEVECQANITITPVTFEFIGRPCKVTLSYTEFDDKTGVVYGLEAGSCPISSDSKQGRGVMLGGKQQCTFGVDEEEYAFEADERFTTSPSVVCDDGNLKVLDTLVDAGRPDIVRHHCRLPSNWEQGVDHQKTFRSGTCKQNKLIAIGESCTFVVKTGYSTVPSNVNTFDCRDSAPEGRTLNEATGFLDVDFVRTGKGKGGDNNGPKEAGTKRTINKLLKRE